MNFQGLFGAPVSEDEAKNQHKEILRLREEFSTQNPYARNGEAMDWAIESYFNGVRSSLSKALAKNESPGQLDLPF
jgi:hypothetical protein|tara:strand:+ start:285 stop:512 length:228 start_codon:yes stop_codon:yes gene_type:complete